MADTPEIPTSGSEEEPKSAVPAVQQPDQSKKVRALFSVGRVNLTKEELESPGVLKMLVERIDDCEEELNRLRPVEREALEAKADLRVVKLELVQVKKNKLIFEILATTMLVAGSAGLSAAKSLFTAELLFYGVGISLILIAGGLVTKTIQLWPR